jgi:hypothetical protein
MQFVAGSQVPGLGAITHEIVDYDPARGFDEYHHGQSRTLNMFLPLLLMATLALLVEGWLANPRRAKSEKATQSKGTPETSPAGESDSGGDEPNRAVPVGGRAG